MLLVLLGHSLESTTDRSIGVEVLSNHAISSQWSSNLLTNTSNGSLFREGTANSAVFGEYRSALASFLDACTGLHVVVSVFDIGISGDFHLRSVWRPRECPRSCQRHLWQGLRPGPSPCRSDLRQHLLKTCWTSLDLYRSCILQRGRLGCLLGGLGRRSGLRVESCCL